MAASPTRVSIKRLTGRGADTPSYTITFLNPMLLTGRSLNWSAAISFEDVQAIYEAAGAIVRRECDQMAINAERPGTADFKEV